MRKRNTLESVKQENYKTVKHARPSASAFIKQDRQ